MAYHLDGAVTPEFASALVELAEAWDARLTEERIRVYAKALGDVPWPQLMRALGACVRECRQFPTVAEILRHAQPGLDDEALLAWTGLCNAVREVGGWAPVVVEDGAAAQALADVFGSWAAFCAVPEGPELALKRQQFLAAYRNQRRLGRHRPRRLDGQCAPACQLAAATWVGRVSGARVSAERDRPQIVAGRERPALGEGADPEAAEGAEEPPGGAGRT